MESNKDEWQHTHQWNPSVVKGKSDTCFHCGINRDLVELNNWEEELKKYKDAVARTLNILLSEGYVGGKTVKDYEIIKAFPNKFSQELEKAREEGRQEGLVENPDSLFKLLETIRQEERTRLLGILDAKIVELEGQDWTDNISLLESLKGKINE